MPHSAASDLGLHYLPIALFGVFRLKWAKIVSFTCRPISSENIGHKLLKKMGWSEGESLGKENTGIHEPVCTCTSTRHLTGRNGA